MKKLITILLFAPILLFGQENNKEKFLELNIGIAATDGYDLLGDFREPVFYLVKQNNFQKMEFLNTK